MMAVNGTSSGAMVSGHSPSGPTESSKRQEAVAVAQTKPAECVEMQCDQFPTSGPLTDEQRMHEILYHGAGR